MPITIADLEAKFSVDLSPMRAGFAAAAQQIRAFVGQTKTTAASLKEVSAAAKGFRDQAEFMDQSLAKFMAAEGAAQARAVALTGSVDASRAAFAQAARYEQALAAETNRLATLQAGLGRTTAGLAAQYSLLVPEQLQELARLKEQTAALEKAEQATKRETVTLRQFGVAASQLGRSLTLGVTAPLLALGGLALSSSQQIQRAMNAIRQQTGATGQQLALLGQSFRAVAAQVPQDMETVGKAVAVVAQRTGLTGTALTKLSTQFLTLSRITGQDVNPLIVKATQVFHQYGIAAGQQEEALNQLNRAHEATGIGVDDLLGKLLKFAPTFQQVGIGAAEAEALLGAFNRQGAQGDKALTALNTAMVKWAKAGIKDARGALEGLIEGVKKAPTAFAALEVAREAGLGGRGGAAFVSMVRSGGLEMQKFLQIILTGKETVQKAGDDTLTLSYQFDQLKNKIILAAEPLETFAAKQLQDLGKALDKDTPKIQAFFRAFGDQSGSLKTTELVLAGIVGLLGPGLLVLGRSTLSFVALKQAWLTGWERMGAAALAALSLVNVAIVGLGLVFLALLNNWFGVADKFKGGGVVIAETFKNLAASIGHVFSNLWDSLRGGFSGLLTRLKNSVGQFGAEVMTSLDRGMREGAKEIAARQALATQRAQEEKARAASEAATAVGSSNIGALLERTEPAIPGKPKPFLFPRTLGSGGGTAPNLANETAAHSRLREALLAEARAEEVLKLVQQGKSLHQAEIIARYDKMADASTKAAGRTTQAIALHTEALDTQAHKIDAVRVANAKAAAIVAQLIAKEKELRAELEGHAKSRVPQALSRVPDADRNHQQALAQEQGKVDALQAQVNAKHKAENEATAKATADFNRLNHQIDATLARQAAALAVDRTTTKADATEQELWNQAQASGSLILKDKADQIIAQIPAVAAHAAAEKQLDHQWKLQVKTLDALEAVSLSQQEAEDRLAGEGKQLTAVQKALNLAYETGDPILIDMAEASAAYGAQIDKATKHQKASAILTEKLNALGLQAKEVMDSFGGSVTLTAKATEMLSAAMKNGDPAVVKLAQDILKQARAADALKKAHKEGEAEARRWAKAMHEAAHFFQSEFERAFKDIFQHGFKGFFKTILADLDQLLQDMAAKILAKKLTQLLLGDAASASGGQGDDAQGGGGKATTGLGGIFGSLFGGLAGKLFGAGAGGSPSADAIMAMTGGDAAAPMATGGDLMAGKPAWVGEEGPELFIPRTAGRIVPHGAAAGAGGGTVNHFHFAISTPDVAGFRKSQSQILGDAQRQAEMHRLRDGG